MPTAELHHSSNVAVLKVSPAMVTLVFTLTVELAIRTISDEACTPLGVQLVATFQLPPLELFQVLVVIYSKFGSNKAHIKMLKPMRGAAPPPGFWGVSGSKLLYMFLVKTLTKNISKYKRQNVQMLLYASRLVIKH